MKAWPRRPRESNALQSALRLGGYPAIRAAYGMKPTRQPQPDIACGPQSCGTDGRGKSREGRNPRKTSRIVDATVLGAVRRGVELDRKGIHLLASVFALVSFYVPEPWASGFLGIIALSVVAVDYSRLRLRRWAQAVYRRFPYVFRGDERHTLSGASVLMLGIALASALFPAGPATAGILCVVWGDAAAAVVGQAYGNRRQLGAGQIGRLPAVRRREGKTVIGTLGCFAVSSLMVLLVVGPQPAAILIGGASAALWERWTPGRWDNLTIPLGTALAVQAVLNGWLT